MFDVSEANNGSTYTNLSEALSAVPNNIRKGGLTIKFIKNTPATYSVVKTDSVTEQPTGTEVQEALNIESGSYTADQLSGITLPAAVSGSVTYYLAATDDNTYTTWVITKATDDIQKYVQYRLMTTAWSTAVSNWYGENKEDYWYVIDSTLGTQGHIGTLYKMSSNNLEVTKYIIDTDYIISGSGTNYFLIFDGQGISVKFAARMKNDDIILLWFRKINGVFQIISGELFDCYIEAVTFTYNKFLFFEDFTKSNGFNISDFISLSGEQSSLGNLIQSGIANAIVFNKTIILDNWYYCAEITTVANTERFCLATRITQASSANHSTLLEVDFNASKMRLYNCGTGQSTPDTATLAEEVDITNKSGNDYIVKLVRFNRAIKGFLYNCTTGASIEIYCADTTTPGSNYGSNRAGKMYDNPVCYSYDGSIYIKKLYASCTKNPKVLFVGDSITQGAHNAYEDSWAIKCAEYFGNSLTGGRGSGKVSCTLAQLTTMLDYINPRVVVVTIGTNNTDITQSSRNTIKNQFLDIINLIKSKRAIPIINRVCNSTARYSTLTIINEIISELDELSCRFDLATSIGNIWENGADKSLFYTDNVHLNETGNEVLYNWFIREFEWIKNI